MNIFVSKVHVYTVELDRDLLSMLVNVTMGYTIWILREFSALLDFPRTLILEQREA